MRSGVGNPPFIELSMSPVPLIIRLRRTFLLYRIDRLGAMMMFPHIIAAHLTARIERVFSSLESLPLFLAWLLQSIIQSN